MNTDALRAYRFATPAQWDACLIAQGDRVSSGDAQALRPFPPYERESTLHPSGGAHAPVATRAGEILWRDDAGRLYRLWPGDEPVRVEGAAHSLRRAARIVATAGGLWVAAPPTGRLQRFDPDTLARVLTADITRGRILDLAGDGRKALYALVRRGAWFGAVPVDASGRRGAPVQFDGVRAARRFAFIRRASRFVVLAGHRHQQLYWFDAAGGAPIHSTPVAAHRACFRATALASDMRDRVFVAGEESEDFGGRPYVLIFDGDGNAIGDVPLDAAATGVAVSRDSLLVTSRLGLSRFRTADVVPEGSGEVRFQVISPALFSPDREDRRRWLRIDASASLPEGSTLEIAFASTDDARRRDQLNAIAGNDAIPVSERMRTLTAQEDLWRASTAFQGSASRAGAGAPPLSAALFDVRDRYLWVSVTVRAAAGSALPRLSELAVRYPGRSLMEHLPAIYRREEQQPGSFLRALVGVLETTTQDLDRRIGSMGRRIHPATAEGPWLDYVARWLGLPWDDTLDERQKRGILQRAAEIAKGRGTRAGLEAFLEALMPDTPRRFRVVDATADHGFAIVGGACCPGSELPAMLGGQTQWHAELDGRIVLGHARLPCPGRIDDGVGHLAGRVQVELAATAAERQAWQHWLPGVIRQLVPAMTRLSIVWTSAQSLRGDRLDGTLTLDPAPTPRLGTDAITDLARFPERNLRLSASGPGLSRRLR